MEKTTEKIGSTPSSPKKRIYHNGRARGQSRSPNWKRLPEWHRLIREQIEIERTPMDTLTSGSPLSSILSLNLKFEDMMEIGLFLNEVYSYLDPSRMEYKRKFVKGESDASLPNYLLLMVDLIKKVGEANLQTRIVINEKDDKKWAELQALIKHNRRVPGADGYNINYYGHLFFKENPIHIPEALHLAVNAALIGNELLSHQLHFCTDLDALSLITDYFDFTQDDIVKTIKRMDNEDPEKLSEEMEKSEEPYLYYYVEAMLNSLNTTTESILIEYELNKEFHDRKKSLLDRFTSLCHFDKRQNYHLIKFTKKLLLSAIKSLIHHPNKKEANTLKHLLEGMIDLIKTSDSSLPNLPDINWDAETLSDNYSLSELYTEFRQNHYVIFDLMSVDLVGLINHEDRLMQVGIEFPEEIPVKLTFIEKLFNQDCMIKIKTCNDTIQLINYLGKVETLRNKYFELLSKLNSAQ